MRMPTAIRVFVLLSVPSLIFSAQRAAAQEMQALQWRADEAADSARAATRASLEALIHYPRDVRDAILTLSSHPDVIVRLAQPGNQPAAALSDYPADVQSAVRIMASHPEAAKAAAEHLPTLTLIGQVCAGRTGEVQDILAREGEKVTASREMVLDSWREKLSSRAEAAAQLKDAVRDFEAQGPIALSAGPPVAALQAAGRESAPIAGAGLIGATSTGGLAGTAMPWRSRVPTANALSSGLFKPLPADLYERADGFGIPAGGPVDAASIHSLPDSEQTYFVMSHADRYPDLAAAIAEQWQREQNPASFREAVDYWWARNQEFLPTGLAGDRDLPALLKERVQLEKAYAAAMQSGSPGAPIVSRGDFLSQNGQDFPNLGRVRQSQMIARMGASSSNRVSGAPFSSSRSGSSSGRSSSSNSAGMGSSSRGSTRSRSSGGGGLSGIASNASSGRSSNGRYGNGRNNSNNSGFGNSRGGSGGFGGGSSGFGGSGSGFGGSGFGGSGSGFGGSGFGGSGFGGGGSGFGGSGFGGGGNSSGFGSSSSGFGSRNSSSRLGQNSSNSRFRTKSSGSQSGN